MWGTQVQSLIQEDSTCYRAIKLVPRNSWARSLEPGATATEATCRSWWSPPTPEPLLLCFVWESVVAGRGEGGGGWISAWRFLCVSKSLQSCLTLCDPMDCSLRGSFVHGDSSGKNTGVCCHYLLQGIFPTQGLSQHLLHLLHWQAGSLSLDFFFFGLVLKQ